jgi:hypothetical protein
MAQICGKCAFANPPDAAYCYNDGALLEGHTAQGGALARGSQPFPSQFVFPSGQACGTFDQLAVACQDHWQEAADLLREGYLASFLSGLGRADLAAAAEEAARFPDADRGLDQLLARLPSKVLESPKLKAEPADVNLGIVPMGGDRHFELHLSNLGGRLLYGSVGSDSKWLTLGEAPGNARKLFQLRGEAAVAVQVRGQHLRAGNKPLEGQLLVDSNGGKATVRVRVEVPARPFPRGVLAGAATPREVAVKAKQAPKEAALLFEDGSVAHWYKDNGWTYPVQAPTASGLGAVQQFFEALGLASAPKVEVAEKSVALYGTAGQALQHPLEVRTREKRPVWAWGTSDQPWLDVGRATLNGRLATLPLVIRSVPDRPGETLEATVNVTANGNQRLAVPVTLLVGPGSPFAFTDDAPVAAVPVEVPPAPAAQPVPGVPVGSLATGPPPAAPAATPALTLAPRARPGRGRAWVHLLPAGLLLFALLVTVFRDLLLGGAASDNVPVDPHVRVRIGFDYRSPDNGAADVGNTMSFGVATVDPEDPDQPKPKRLTYDLRGRTNSVVVRIDDKDHVFGHTDGRWAGPPKNVGRWGGKKATWVFDQRVAVTQTVELVPGEPQVVGGAYKRLLDTCLVYYTVENQDDQKHTVGLRFLLDTYIGRNDGVPFTVPGQPGLVDEKADYKGPAEVPDFVQVLENADLKDPGTVAQVNLRLGGKLEAPERVSLTHWPGRRNDLWIKFDVPVVPMATPLEKDEGQGDSAVVLYWGPRDLEAHGVREVGFTYGLGSMATGTTGRLGISVGGALVVHNELTVVGLVTKPAPGETVTLELPEGLTLAAGTPATQPVPPRGASKRPSPVTWRVQANRPGDFDITVRSNVGPVQERRITIRARPLF